MSGCSGGAPVRTAVSSVFGSTAELDSSSEVEVAFHIYSSHFDPQSYSPSCKRSQARKEIDLLSK